MPGLRSIIDRIKYRIRHGKQHPCAKGCVC